MSLLKFFSNRKELERLGLHLDALGEKLEKLSEDLERTEQLAAKASRTEAILQDVSRLSEQRTRSHLEHIEKLEAELKLTYKKLSEQDQAIAGLKKENSRVMELNANSTKAWERKQKGHDETFGVLSKENEALREELAAVKKELFEVNEEKDYFASSDVKLRNEKAGLMQSLTESNESNRFMRQYMAIGHRRFKLRHPERDSADPSNRVTEPESPQNQES